MNKSTLLFLLSVFLFACLYTAAGAVDKPVDELYRIVAVQHQSFPPYEQDLKGFKKGIDQSELKGRVELELYNADNDLKALDQYIQDLKSRKDVNLIFSMGTQATQRMIDQIKDNPIVFTDLGAPETSGVVTDWKSSGANYTGVESRNYVGIGVNLLHELIAFKSIGMVYLTGSPSHEGAIKIIEALGREVGFDFVAKGFALRDENNNKYPDDVVRKKLREALEQVVPRVDVFYVQSSATFEQNFDLFFNCFKKYSVPSAGEQLYIKKGLVIGIGRHKERFGFQCAEYAVKILTGTDPATLPMDVGKEFSFALNIEAATIVGYNPSIDILGAADQICREIEP
ncbi:ABC transporter substrate binding protein [uncultured Desulfobacter sp.]|uniref:ABC transporter substrate binding protein n=1 Tax=uncultured Desulfobacter sp. TaxID=240139 RepID=UPI002AAB63D9|nr:ABC transporter substrate binding protein [uncultured Desulfobacter sp.]